MCAEGIAFDADEDDAVKTGVEIYKKTNKSSTSLNSYLNNEHWSPKQKDRIKQRMGRVGRTQKGYVHLLYTKQKFNSLKSYSNPKILSPGFISAWKTAVFA